MGNALAHRGPDAKGHYHNKEGTLFFEHRRLAIIDLSPAGVQPIYNEDRTIVAMVNGEIYNYSELRQQLMSRGHRFASQCDIETVVHLFEDEGTDGWSRLRGMFAIAIHDSKTGELHLARDPLGIKPLYVFEGADLIAFSSEIRAFSVLKEVSRQPDVDGWMDFLLLGSIPAPRTHLQGIRALRPGETLRITGDRFHAQGGPPIPGWCREVAADPQKNIAVVGECICDSVRRHMVSDVPTGIFLSGGIDSGTLAGVASEIAGSTVGTVSVTVPGHALDESVYARRTAQVFGTRHTEVPLDQGAFERDFEAFMDHLDLPSIDGFNTFVVSKAARTAGLTVALSGVGGDELFGGYNSFHLAPRFMRIHRLASLGGGIGRAIPSWLLERVRDGSSTARVAGIFRRAPADIRMAYLACRGLFDGRFLEDLVIPDLRPRVEAAFVRYLDETAWTIQTPLSSRLAVGGLELTRYMTSQLLRDTDALSMAHSLEVRTPLVDVEVVRTCLPFLARETNGDGQPKWLLRQALKRPLPPEVVARPKQGFTFPWQEWLSGVVLKDFDRRLEAGGDWTQILQPQSVRWWRDAYARGWAHWSCFWALYVLIRFVGTPMTLR